MKRFLLLSLLLHVLLVTSWPSRWTQQPSPMPLPTLALQLQAVDTALQTGNSRLDGQPPTPRQPDVAATHQEPLPGIEPTASAPQFAPVDNTDTQQAHEPAGELSTAQGQDNETDTALSNVRAAVYTALQAHFSYPRRARLRGWEGTVVIALRILPDGAVTDVRISDSSGIRVLDDAAIRSVSAMHVPEVVAWMNGHGIDMIIPVEYHLTDS